MKYLKLSSTGFYLSIGVFVCLSQSAFANSVKESWLDSQILKHPDVIEALELVKAAKHRNNSAALPIYNPTIQGELGKEGAANTFSIGVNQTLDLWGKGTANEQAAKVDYFIAEKNLENVTQVKKAEIISALIKWKMAKKLAFIAAKQEQQLKQLLSIGEEKSKVGLLAELDQQILKLNLSQAIVDIAKNQLKLQSAEIRLNELLPNWSPQIKILPENGLGFTNYTFNEDWIKEHPNVQLAHAQFLRKQAIAKQTIKQTKADPTLGINTGKNGQDKILGISFSLPINIRNNYSQDIKAAYSESYAAEAAYRSLYRKQLFTAKANYEALQLNQQYFKQWQSTTQQSATIILQLLKQRWDSGDISTSEYLLALNQRANALYSGIKLEENLRLKEVSYVLSIGQLSKFSI